MMMRILACLVALEGLALAQQPSDLMPRSPTSPAGGRYWVPGVPPALAPAAPSTQAQQGEETAPTDTGKGRGAPVLGPDETGDQGEEGAVGEVPGTHEVQRGETLWDIANRYYGNPSMWPRIWSYNPAITNPHWIFPGDVIRLRPPGDTPPAPTPATPPTAMLAPPEAQPTQPFVLRRDGFADTGELDKASRIIGSPEEKMLLSTGDAVYIGAREAKKDDQSRRLDVSVGQQVTIYRISKPVRHPISNEDLGAMVQILGQAQVRSIDDKNHVAEAVLIDATDPIERDDLVGPLRREFAPVTPTPADRDVDGIIVSTLRPQLLLAPEAVVLIDRGRDDGVKPGNRFVVIRRGDGYARTLETQPVDDPRFPERALAEIVVVDVRPHLATGVLVHALQDIRVGDRVELRRGR